MCTTNATVNTAKCMYMFTMVTNMHGFLDSYTWFTTTNVYVHKYAQDMQW